MDAGKRKPLLPVRQHAILVKQRAACKVHGGRETDHAIKVGRAAHGGHRLVEDSLSQRILVPADSIANGSIHLPIVDVNIEIRHIEMNIQLGMSRTQTM